MSIQWTSRRHRSRNAGYLRLLGIRLAIEVPLPRVDELVEAVALVRFRLASDFEFDGLRADTVLPQQVRNVLRLNLAAVVTRPGRLLDRTQLQDQIRRADA